MHMLDTNICIYVLKHHSDRLRHRFKVTRSLCVSAVTYAELCFGIESGPAAARRARWEQLDAFTRLLLIEPLDAEAGRRYGRLRAWLRRRGMPIGNNDLFIAAHALSLGAVLVTNNEREFGRIPDLLVENWS
ncbi:MAG: PIN domain-containing protein [Lysobacterales bacterium]|jgi:tRNA(fMet)-specific endonuclease VapC